MAFKVWQVARCASGAKCSACTPQRCMIGIEPFMHLAENARTIEPAGGGAAAMVSPGRRRHGPGTSYPSVSPTASRRVFLKVLTKRVSSGRTNYRSEPPGLISPGDPRGVHHCRKTSPAPGDTHNHVRRCEASPSSSSSHVEVERISPCTVCPAPARPPYGGNRTK